MQVRRQITSDRADILNADVAETALMLQSIRHEVIRCERRIADKQIGEATREIEEQSLDVLKKMSFKLAALFSDRRVAPD